MNAFFERGVFTLDLIEEIHKGAEEYRDNDNEKFNTLLKAINKRIM